MPLERRSTASRNRSATSVGGALSRRSHTSPGRVPGLATAAHSVVASRRGSGRPARSSRAIAASRASAIEPRPARSGTEALFLAGELQGADQVVQLAVQYVAQVVGGIVDTVIRDAVLREVVRADLGRAVPRADLCAPLPRAVRFLLREHLVEQPRPQHFQRLDLVLQLALLVLALHDEARGEVSDADGAVGGVHALAPRTLGAEHVDPEILLLDLDVDLLRFRQHGDRGGGGVNAALRLGGRDALHAVHPRLVPQGAVRLRAPGREDRFLQPPEVAFGEGDDLDLPAPRLAEAGVHPEQVRREQRGFVAARPGADLHDRVAIGERIGRRQQLGERALEALDLGPQPVHVGAGPLGPLGGLLMEYLASLGEVAAQPLQAVVGAADGVEPPVVAPPLLELCRGARGLGGGPRPGDLLPPAERLAESGLHGSASGLLRPVLPAEPFHAPGGIHELLLPGVVRMAAGADLDVDHGRRRARDEAVAARALHRGALIGRMNPGFHCTYSSTLNVGRHEGRKYNWRRELAASAAPCADLTAVTRARKLAPRRPSRPRKSNWCPSRRSSRKSRCSANLGARSSSGSPRSRASAPTPRTPSSCSRTTRATPSTSSRKGR